MNAILFVTTASHGGDGRGEVPGEEGAEVRGAEALAHELEAHGERVSSRRSGVYTQKHA